MAYHDPSLQVNAVPVTSETIMAVLPRPTNPNIWQDDCPVCHEHYTNSHSPVILPCNHIFGKPCLRRWLHDNETCPLCRKIVVKRDDGDETFVSDEASLEDLNGQSAQDYRRAFLDIDVAVLPAAAREYHHDITTRIQGSQQDDWVQDVRYQFIRSRKGFEFDAELTHPERFSQDLKLDVDVLVMSLWETFTRHLAQPSLPDRTYNMWQHPLTSALVLAICKALSQFRGFVQSRDTLHWCLDKRMTTFENEFPDFDFRHPHHWLEMKQAVVEEVCNAHVCEWNRQTVGGFRQLAKFHKFLF